jgi:hypothetical protein
MDTLPQEPSIPPQSTPTPKDFVTALRQTGPDRFRVAASLLDRGADLNGIHEKFAAGSRRGGNAAVLPRTKVTALYDAAQRGDFEAVQFLLSRGADARARNRTGMGIISGLMFPSKSIETLCALDCMRLSRNLRIVQLAEEMYGLETEEEFVKRRDAFDELMHPRYARSSEFVKSTKRRVKSVLPKSSAKKSQEKQGQPDVAEESADTGEKRYDLRSRNLNLSYV